MRRLVLLVLVLSVLAGGGTGHAQSVPDVGGGSCAEPYLPWYSAIGRLYSDEPAPPEPDETLTFSLPPFDMDGDGAPDVIAADQDPAQRHRTRVVRGDGEVVLETAEEKFLHVQPIGDLDGDGRDELLVVEKPDGAVPPGEEFWQIIVPGATPPGTVDPREAGIRVRLFGPFLVPTGLPPSGDQNRDGADDVMQLPAELGTTMERPTVGLISGRDVMAVGPGGDARSIEPFRQVPHFFGVVPLGDPGPAFVSARPVDGGLELTVGADPSVVLRTSPDAQPRPAGVAMGTGMLSAYRSDGDRIVAYSYGDRSGNDLILWNLDDPCAVWAPAGSGGAGSGGQPGSGSTPLPPSSPARPVTGTPTYTG